MQREYRIALLARRFALLADRVEFARPDPAERVEATLRARRPIPLSLLDQAQIVGAGELDRLCGAAVRRLRSTGAGAPALLDVLGHLDADRLCGVYYATPEGRRGRLRQDGAWAYHVAQVEATMADALTEIEAIAREGEGFAKRRSELVAEMSGTDAATWERFEREQLRCHAERAAGS